MTTVMFAVSTGSKHRMGSSGLIQKSGKHRYIVCLLLTIVIFFSYGCNQYKKNKTHLQIDDDSIRKGELLAKQHCQTCHQFPDPSLLSSANWEKGVLPEMGPHLGIMAYGFFMYPSSADDPNIGAAFYPDRPVISFTDWQNIIDYYTSLAPDTLMTSNNNISIPSNNLLFVPEPTDTCFSYFKPVTGCLHIDTSYGSHTFFIADITRKSLTSVNQKLKPVDSIKYKSPVADMLLQNDTLFTANIGYPNPNDGKSGSIQQIKFNQGHFYTKPVTLKDSLRRPVHLNVTDLNNDGLKDILVCEYGNLKGALSWLENKGNNQYERRTIREQPGAITAVVKDFNSDGLPDCYVLFAQGDEQIVRFQNKGNGSFEAKQLLRFPPVYGSSYFEMDDINKDGYDDIIYTCGDNADYSVELKPYHGVYIFINDGKDNFTQRYFFHINGCFKAMARDFDRDGDIDIAAISFFADYKNRPEEGFVYLENKGDYRFIPFSVPAAKNGRWISMDVNDIDGDGKPDIVLGNFSFKSFIPSSVDWKQQPAFLLLKNNMP